MSKVVVSGRTNVAEVAVIPPIAGHEVLSYAVPAGLATSIAPGQRVLVPLAQRQVTGIVVAVGDERDVRGVRLRDVLDVLDAEPLLSPELLGLCRFAARYYMASLGEVLATAVLAGLRAETRRTVRRTSHGAAATPREPLGRVEREILARLTADGPVRTSAIARAVRSSSFYEALRSLAARGFVVIEELAARAAANVRFARIATAGREPSEAEQVELERRARAQCRLLARIREAGERGLDTAELDPKDGAPLRALVERGLVRIDRRELYRAVGGKVSAPSRPLVPNAEQRRAIEAIDEVAAAGRFETFLLRGVTGSGKTEVYLQAAARVLATGRGVLILVPEIALTPDLVERVCSRFGASVAVLHSGLSAGERFDEWRRLARGEARIAVGVRSAVFAPVRRLGLVVVDEEHDVAYKQEDGLRYNARDLAIVRARDSRCPAVLGSATPAIESHHNAAAGRYRLLELAERVERRPMPAVEVIDLKIERPEGDPPVLSPRLRDAIVANFAAGGQTLVFLNRRGYAHYLQCTLCGHVMSCPNCSVTLTFHLRARRARCHHCDYSVAAPELCPECHSPHLRDIGIGTEQVEAVLAALLPRARIARMDRDTVARKGALANLLEAWRSRRLDVLVGTQMVAKGHDVAGVTLVGVVAPDQTLNFPDFRAAERTFQMLTQVAGRAGRGDQPGRVLIQTYRPTHYALRFALFHDFTGFAAEEIHYREALGYPPFSRLLNLRFDGLDGARVEKTARAAVERLRAANESAPRARRAAILGPATAPLEKLRGRYRWQILLKARETRILHELVRPLLDARGGGTHDRAVRLSADVDPYGML
jgi:primosomal protein N' (replication factor Y) (superfamily II helicase)